MESIAIYGPRPRGDAVAALERDRAIAEWLRRPSNRAASAEKITKHALTAPGDPARPSRPSSAAVLDQLDRLTAAPDSDRGYGTGETSKHNLPDLNVDADLHGTAATVPDSYPEDIETDPLAGAEVGEYPDYCPGCGFGGYLGLPGDVCTVCGYLTPGRRGQASHRTRRATVERVTHPGARILGVS